MLLFILLRSNQTYHIRRRAEDISCSQSVFFILAIFKFPDIFLFPRQVGYNTLNRIKSGNQTVFSSSYKNISDNLSMNNTN